jgi:hypothetical protein
MTTWKWNGARWWKFDFHVHTPASEDYGKGPDQQTLRQRTAREWLLDFMRAGIDCLAVTDHNIRAWIDWRSAERLRHSHHVGGFVTERRRRAFGQHYRRVGLELHRV